MVGEMDWLGLYCKGIVDCCCLGDIRGFGDMGLRKGGRGLWMVGWIEGG